MPTEEMYESASDPIIFGFKKDFKKKLQQKKYSEAYNLVVMTAVEERGRPIDAQSIQGGSDLISKAVVDGNDAVMSAFRDIASGVKDSEAPKTSKAMLEVLDGGVGGGFLLPALPFLLLGGAVAFGIMRKK
jgi:hypothetical protein